MDSIAIIGAGIAGITLARQLQDSAKVTVFEKSRGFGGRMATRRTDSYQFDHGAQFFTARSKQFQEQLNTCIREQHAQVWTPRVLTLDNYEKPFKREWFEPHYVAVPGMNSLCKALAEEIDVALETPIASIETDGHGWRLENVSGTELGSFDWVISTAPAPQTDELLPDCFAHKSALGEVDFSPCFSLMLGFDSSPTLNFDATVVRNSPLGWIAVDSSKQGRQSSFSLVAQSDNTWARMQLDSNIDDVQNRMLIAFNEVMGDSLPKPNHSAIHRWKYAKVESSLEEFFLFDESNRLAACGDWCGGNRVEDAYLSGLKLGEHLRGLLKSKA